MKSYKTVFLFSIVFLLAASPSAFPRSGPQDPAGARQSAKAPEKEGVMVGRLSFVEGELLRYVPAEKDWVVTVKDTPFGLDDALYSGEDARAELTMPNSTSARIAPSTQIQMIALKPDLTEVDIASGVARFYDRGSKTVVKATTPFGYVTAQPGAVFDVYVGDESVEVIGVKGKVDFIHDADGARYEVVAGAQSILADAHQAGSGEGKVDGGWDDWNLTRESVWAKKLETRGESVKYLPEPIREDADTLDENGRWERVDYEGSSRTMWRPTSVDPGWAPYTDGRWTTWDDEQVWVPYEPYGWVTHHYGSWVWADPYWYWAPPVVSIGVGWPYWGIGFGWYPGRVGWMYSGAYIGWFPLAWWEPYYTSHYWGPNCFVGFGYWGRYAGFHRYRYWNSAVVINRSHFFTANNYRTAGIARAGRSFAGKFQGTPGITNKVIGNTDSQKQRFNFTNKAPTAKPAQTVNSRIARNQTAAQQSASLNGAAVRQQTASARIGRAAPNSAVQQPKATSRISSSGAGAGARDLKQNPRALGSRTTAPEKVGSASGKQGGSALASPRARTGQQGRTGAGSARVGPQASKKQSVSPNAKARPQTSGQRSRIGSSGSQVPKSDRQVQRAPSARQQATPGQRPNQLRRGDQSRGSSQLRGGASPQGRTQDRSLQRAPQGRQPSMQRAPQGGSPGGIQRAPQGRQSSMQRAPQGGSRGGGQAHEPGSGLAQRKI